MDTLNPNNTQETVKIADTTSVSSQAANPDLSVPLSEETLQGVELSENPDAIYHYFVASPMFAGFGDLASPDRIYFLQDVNQMSPNLRSYLTSAETVEAIFALGKEYDLKDGQITDMSILVRDFLTGKIFIKDFPSAISSKFGIDDVKAGELANKLISKSFAPIIEDVKRIQRTKFPDKIQQLQKESQPTGLTQKQPGTDSSRPPMPTPSTLQQVAPPSTPLSVPSPANLPPKQESAFNSQPPQKPPLSISPRPDNRELPIAQPPVLPKQIEVTKPATMPPLNMNTESVNPMRPEQPKTIPTSPNRSEFKIPDLDALTKQPNNPTSGKDSEAQRSLEAELEKVANVIDLRTQSKE